MAKDKSGLITSFHASQEASAKEVKCDDAPILPLLEVAGREKESSRVGRGGQGRARGRSLEVPSSARDLEFWPNRHATLRKTRAPIQRHQRPVDTNGHKAHR
ncbi:hypothetical protein E4U53_006791 [Claviceps sorghi]|nr:hypothetical protein E4U53_006791 [Claviceps sorghi]